MKDGLEVKSILFGELRQVSSKEFRDSTGLDWSWDSLRDGTDVKLILTNSSEKARIALIHVISRPDIPTTAQLSWGDDIEIKPGEEKEINYVVPMPGIPSSDYRDYTGPLRYMVEVTVFESSREEILLKLKKAKYYDIPAKVEAGKLEMSEFDIDPRKLEKTTILHDLHIDGDPKEGIKSIRAKLLNFGEKTQYIGIDIRAMGLQRNYQTQFFYEVEPKKEILVDISGVVTAIPEKEYIGPVAIRPKVESIRIRAASIPERVFRSQVARSWFLWRSCEEEEDYKNLIAKIDFYFKEVGPHVRFGFTRKDIQIP